MVMEYRQCKSQNIEDPGVTSVAIHLSSYTKPPKPHGYHYEVIDTSQYCGKKTPKVVNSENDCGSDELCCTIPSGQRYDNDYKRFVPKGAMQDLTCDQGVCETTGFTKSTTKCYNDTDCHQTGKCYDPKGGLKSAYEVSYYNPNMTCNQSMVNSQQTDEPIFCPITTKKYSNYSKFGSGLSSSVG
jgi:hypothetical protein